MLIYIRNEWAKDACLATLQDKSMQRTGKRRKRRRSWFFSTFTHPISLFVENVCRLKSFFCFMLFQGYKGCFYRNQIQTSIHLSHPPPLSLSPTEWRNTKILFVLLSSTLMDTLQLLASLLAPLFNQVTLTMIMNKYRLPFFSFIYKLACCFPSTAVREKTLSK